MQAGALERLKLHEQHGINNQCQYLRIMRQQR